MRIKFLAFIILVALCALSFFSEAYAEAVIGQAAPALVTTTLDGKAFDLSSLKGKVVVVHYWATWCAACREEMPALEAVWRQYHGKGLEVLAVSGDRPRAHADVDQVMHYFSFPASLLSASSKDGFGTPAAIPVTYLIDKAGNVSSILTPDIMSLSSPGFGDQVKALIEAKLEASKTETKSDAKPEAKTDTKTDETP